MSSWGNTDSIYDKPHWPKEREVRFLVTLTTANSIGAGNTRLFFAGTNSVSNIAVTANLAYLIAANVGVSGEAGFFASNTFVTAVTGNTVTFSPALYGNVPAGASIEIDVKIPYPATERSNTYNKDTVLVTDGRLANASFGDTTDHSGAHSGWNYVTTGTGPIAGIAVSNSNTSFVYTNTYINFFGANTSPANAQLIVIGTGNVSVVLNSGGAGYSWPTANAGATTNNGSLIFTLTPGGRMGRVQCETLVTLSNATAYNANSGNTSVIGTRFSGV